MAEAEPGPRVEVLLKFFEALAQFAVTAMLSAYIPDEDMAAKKSLWLGAGGDGRPLDLRVASFGLWTELSARLAKTGRQLDPSRRQRLFSASNTELVDALISRDLQRALVEARERRNLWTGHGGIPSHQVQADRARELEDLLRETRAVLGTAFDAWLLIKPGPAVLARGLYNLVATVLKGPNPRFQQKQFSVTRPFDSAFLYLLNSGEPEGLQLMPFISLMPNGLTGESTCYFYSRIAEGGVRWVSYHFSAQPDLVQPDAEVERLVSEFVAEAFRPADTAGQG